MRKYPAGIQSFEKIRQDGYLYVDKTALIYKMITAGVPYFLSRPRRFGKSLLISTLAAVFEGRRELFEAFTTEQGIEQPALYISTTDWKWDKYPVIRFDFSKCVEYTLKGLQSQINHTLSQYEQEYGLVATTDDNSIRFENIILAAYKRSGKRVVVLVDEYDTVIIHNLGNREQEHAIRECILGTFGLLKAMDDYLQFVFLTGISRFSQMGIFSRLNNLTNISMAPDYDSICGFSEEELTTVFHEDIAMLGNRNGLSYEEQLGELKRMYDGYHFSKRMTDMYNPFSLTNALNVGDVSSYWFDRGTSSALIDMLAKMPRIDIAEIEGLTLPDSAFDLPFESFDNPIPILYQSGYLTIKKYFRTDFGGLYTMGFPNREVRQGFADCLFKHVTERKISVEQSSAMFMAYSNFYLYDDLKAFISALQSFFGGVPYHLKHNNERHYHALLYTLLTAYGADIRAEEATAKGRADLVLKMPKGIYILEFKYDGSAEDALEQIKSRGYADKYKQEHKPITLVGISFSSQERNISEWKSCLVES